jgi:phospholipase/carboxylesterase
VSSLFMRERPAAVRPEGLLVLHHGRGADETDLLALADLLDTGARLQVVTPRAPLQLPGTPGFHWYVVPRVGYPDPRTFADSFELLAALHDELWERFDIPPERTVFGGFSMGAVMSYALGLSAARSAPAGILAFSGFIPTVQGWSPSLVDRPALRTFIAHGRNDPVIGIEFARRARELLTGAGMQVEYHEHELGHQIVAADLAAGASWLSATLGPAEV